MLLKSQRDLFISILPLDEHGSKQDSFSELNRGTEFVAELSLCFSNLYLIQKTR